MRLLLLLALLAVLAPAAHAQDADERAVVYIYQLRHAKTLGRVSPPVYIDERDVAHLDGERYFIARLPPGKHTFHSRGKKQGGIEMELKPGGVYYLRLEMVPGDVLRDARVMIAPEEEAKFSLKQTKPIKPADVKDKSIVDTSYPPPEK